MVHINSYRFRFSVSNLLLITINLSLYLIQYNAVEAATLPNFHSNNDKTEGVCKKNCTTQACLDYENELAKYMNTSVDPCDDFYEFACGNFKNHFSPNIATNTMNEMTITSHTEILQEFNEGIKENDSSAIRKLKIYYQNCMNKTRIEEEGGKILLNILSKIGGWPVLLGDKWNENDFDLMTTIYQIMQENLPLFFPINLDVKESAVKIKVLSIDGPHTVVNDRFSSDKLLDAYFKFMVNTSISLGASESVARKELHDVLIFEKNLYEIQKPKQEDLILEINAIKNISQTNFNISWLEMIIKETRTDVSPTYSAFFPGWNYLQKLEKLFNDTPKRVVANYIAWNFIRIHLKYQPKNLAQLELDFIYEISESTQAPQNRCYNDMNAVLQHGISALFVRNNYNSFTNGDTANLFQSIKEQFKINLEKIDWMDENTRLSASEKVDAMTMELPYPNNLAGDEIDEYFKDLEINPGSYFESFLNVSAFNKKRKFEDLYKAYNKSSWFAISDSVPANAAYQYFFNQMAIPAGFMRSPMYHPEQPQYLNYGGAGTIIGHEITHGFDSTGRQFNKNGNFVDWWQQETKDNFFKKVKCVIDQYDNFILAQTGQHVDGDRTKNENIADNGGFKMAYYAYQMWAERNNINEDCLSSVNYTPQQLFWISAAKNWCSARSKDVAYNNILTDDHSPPEARVITSFSNIKEFAEDFQCKPGSRMNPEKRCIVW